jgi:hypothetical protein
MSGEQDFRLSQGRIPMAEGQSKQALYLYLDEAGNFNFNKLGSKYFILTCVIMRRPFSEVHSKLLDIKYDCIEIGLDLGRFHASDDQQKTRDAFYSVLTEHYGEYEVYSIAMLKSSLDECLREPSTLYSTTFRLLSEYIVSINEPDRYSSVIVITDALSSNLKRKYLRTPLKSYLKYLGESEKLPFALYHHSSAGDLNLQVTDYFCWAVQRYLERGDNRALVLIEKSLKGIWIFGESGVVVKEINSE